MSRLMTIVAATLVVAAVAFAVFRSNRSPGLPVSGTVPEFELIGTDGKPVRKSDLNGKVWIADFIFTKCPGMCPMLTSQMKRVQTALSASGDRDIRLVSISVDPANDSPEALREYGRRYEADPQRWLFLTGERDALYRLIGKGFNLALAERSEEEAKDGQGLITHSDRFVLVDQESRIRGYYHGMEKESVDQLIKDATALAQ